MLLIASLCIVAISIFSWPHLWAGHPIELSNSDIEAGPTGDHLTVWITSDHIDMEPSPTELAGMNDLASAASWAGLTESLRDSLLSYLGMNTTDSLALVATFSESDFIALLGSWKIVTTTGTTTTSNSPHPAAIAKARLFGSACRAKFAPAKTGSLAPSVPGPSSATSRKIKLSLICSQLDESEADLLEESDVLKGYARLEVIYGAGTRPRSDSNPSLEQLSVVSHLVKSQANPYLDFSIFGPHSHRIMKMIKMSTQVFTKDGLQTIELKGPPDLQTWQSSFELQKNCYLMLDICDLGPLLQYEKKIQSYSIRYGPSIWPLIYQADVRARRELAIDIKMRLAAIHSSSPTTSGYQPDRPWNAVYSKMCDDQFSLTFWKEELEDLAIAVLARTANLRARVGDDASIGTSVASQSNHEPQLSPAPFAPGRIPKSPTKRARELPEDNRVTRVDSSGNFTHNRQNVEICPGFNTGECQDTIAGRCKVNPELVHQCSRCLAQSHYLLNCPKPLPGASYNRKGKKKGKGGGKSRNR